MVRLEAYDEQERAKIIAAFGPLVAKYVFAELASEDDEVADPLSAPVVGATAPEDRVSEQSAQADVFFGCGDVSPFCWAKACLYRESSRRRRPP